MPGLNCMGPRGLGPMTGGGRGFCNPVGRGAAFPSHRSFRGRGYHHPYYGAGAVALDSMPSTPRMVHEQELGFLRNQAKELKEQMERLKSSIQQLVNETKDESKE